MKNNMNISEIFYSIQGEGASSGIPAVFIRFSGCNLQCPGCDTKYHINGQKMSLEDVLAKIKEFNPVSKRIVFTGGEPLLYQEDIVRIVEGLKPFAGKFGSYYNWSFEIETNGTIEPELIHKRLCSNHSSIHIRYNVSPKLSFNEKAHNDSDILGTFLSSSDSIFKFVISNDQDIEEVNKMQREISIPKESIYLMPLGATRKEQEKNMPRVIKHCLKTGYKFCPRLHVLVWGNKQGI